MSADERVVELERTLREAQHARAESLRELLLEVVAVADAFEALEAAAKAKAPGEEARGWIDRFLRVRRRVESLLSHHGAQRVNSLGGPFHPEYHEVVEVRPADRPEGTVLEVLAEAYVWRPGDAMQALRKGQVVVAGRGGGEETQ